jgi:hypothetical protein
MNGHQAAANHPAQQAWMRRDDFEHVLSDIEKDADLASSGQFVMARRWRMIDRWSTIALGIIAGVTAVSGSIKEARGAQGATWWTFVTIFGAFVTAVLAAVNGALTPSKKAEAYENSGKSLKALRNRVRSQKKVRGVPREQRVQVSEALQNEMNSIRSASLPISKRAQKEAERARDAKKEARTVAQAVIEAKESAKLAQDAASKAEAAAKTAAEAVSKTVAVGAQTPSMTASHVSVGNAGGGRSDQAVHEGLNS